MSEILIIIFGLAILVLSFYIYYLIWGTIVGKAGYSKAWFLIILVPIVNIIAIWMFAFAKWPNLNKTLDYK